MAMDGPGKQGDMNQRGEDPDGDNWSGGHRDGGERDMQDGPGMQGGPGMQDFGQGRTLQNLPPQIQELLKQFMQGQGGQQVLPQTPITPGTQG